MNYEFFFVRRKARKTPKFIRVFSPDLSTADLLLAEHFGYNGTANDRKAVRAFLRARNVHPVPVVTIFPKRGVVTLRGPEAA